MTESAARSPSTSTPMGFLAGKRFLVSGILSNRSIAYGIARACRREGAELAFSYQGERFKERIGEFAAEFSSSRYRAYISVRIGLGAGKAVTRISTPATCSVAQQTLSQALSVVTPLRPHNDLTQSRHLSGASQRRCGRPKWESGQMA